MNIYDAHQTIPSGFQAITIALDGGMESNLNWDRARKEASRYREQGLKLFFDLDFNFLKNKPWHLDQTHLHALQLSLEHFSATLWKEFSKDTVGVALYRGLLDAVFEGEGMRIAEYLQQLAASLPDEAVPFLLLDARECGNPFLVAQWLADDTLLHFTTAIRGGGVPCSGFAWEEGAGPLGYIGTVSSPPKRISNEATFALCLPASGDSQPLRKAIAYLNQTGYYRIIPERRLTVEWEGLNDIVVDPETLTFIGKRQLMGFCAAGGTVVNLGEKLGFSQEIRFEEWVTFSKV